MGGQGPGIQPFRPNRGSVELSPRMFLPNMGDILGAWHPVRAGHQGSCPAKAVRPRWPSCLQVPATLLAAKSSPFIICAGRASGQPRL